jgi:hypothetical protein
MRFTIVLTSVVNITILGFASPAGAEAMKSKVSFNNTIGQPSGNQPAGGKTVSYQITLKGGELDGCTDDVVESLFGREEGAWGIFDIKGDVKCSGGGFTYTSSGAWDGNGFHAAGAIKDGSGTGKFQGITGRIAQLGGGASKADGGGMIISYDLVVDQPKT